MSSGWNKRQEDAVADVWSNIGRDTAQREDWPASEVERIFHDRWWQNNNNNNTPGNKNDKQSKDKTGGSKK